MRARRRRAQLRQSRPSRQTSDGEVAAGAGFAAEEVPEPEAVPEPPAGAEDESDDGFDAPVPPSDSDPVEPDVPDDVDDCCPAEPPGAVTAAPWREPAPCPGTDCLAVRVAEPEAAVSGRAAEGVGRSPPSSVAGDCDAAAEGVGR
ncbi:hypothetical protein KMS84_31475, partial [Streptomyces sp. IBSBF 2807]|nr:hypothetical protein [Streptomyces hilarionis]